MPAWSRWAVISAPAVWLRNADTQVALPPLQDDEALVQITKTGICGSDVHLLTHGRIGDAIVTRPMCLGHESSGIVVRLGAKASGAGVKLGDRVAVEPDRVCRVCTQCRNGHYDVCTGCNFTSDPPGPYGTLARYFAVPADMCHVLPACATLETGALMEPLAVGCQAVALQGAARSGDVVVVFGAGPVGIMSMAVARALGAARVVAVDISAERLAFAKDEGRGRFAHDVFTPPAKGGDEAVDAYLARAAGEMRAALHMEGVEQGADLCIEASGAASCLGLSLHILKPGGTHVQVGWSVSPMSAFPLAQVINKQLVIKGSVRYGPRAYPLAISLVERGLVDLDGFVTQRYKFKDIDEAFETAKRGRDGSGKMVIKVMIDGPE